MNDTITISTEFLGEHCIVMTLAGRFDAASANALKETFREVIGGAVTCVIADMAGVTFIDSAGLSAFITALPLVRDSGGRLVICAMQPQAHAVFVLTKLDQIISIYPTRQAAVAAVGGSRQEAGSGEWGVGMLRGETEGRETGGRRRERQLPVKLRES